MKVLIQWAGGFDTPGPANHLLKSLIEDILVSGISVHLVQGSIKRINEEMPKDLLGKAGFSYDTLYRKDIPKSSFIRRYFEEACYDIRSVRYWRRVDDVDLVFVRSCPTSVLSIVLSKLFIKKPVVYGIQDMWPGSAVSSGVVPQGFVANFFYSLQKIAYDKSDVLTVISDDMRGKVIEQGVPDEKIHTIVNWYDDRVVHEVCWENNRFVKKYNLPKDRFYVQYAGTMGYVFDYEMVLRVAELLEDFEDIEFQMIGMGSQKEAFVGEKENRGLNNVVFYPLEPQDMVSDVYSTCSVCLIPLKKGIIGNSVPSKAALLMACKRPIINSVDEDSHYYRMFNENEIGVSVSNEDPEAVARAILRLYHNKPMRERMAVNGYNFGKEHYARSKNTAKLIDLFYTVTTKNE